MVRLNPVLLALGVLCALQVPEVSADKKPLDELLDKNIDFSENQHISEPSQIARDFKRARDAYELMFNKWNISFSLEIEDILFKKFDDSFINHFGDNSMLKLQSDRDKCDAIKKYDLSNYVISLEAKALECAKPRIDRAGEIQEKLEKLNDKIEKMHRDVSPCFYVSSSSRSRRSPKNPESFTKVFKSRLADWGSEKVGELAKDALHNIGKIRFSQVMDAWRRGCISNEVREEAKALRKKILKHIKEFKTLRTDDWSPESDCLTDTVFKDQSKREFRQLRQSCKDALKLRRNSIRR